VVGAGVGSDCGKRLATAGGVGADVGAHPPQLQKRCTNWMYEFLVRGGQCFFRLLRAETARLVLKLRAGVRRAARPPAQGGRINGLKGQKGEEAGMSLGVVAGRACARVL
jgi:hypothetical protein